MKKPGKRKSQLEVKALHTQKYGETPSVGKQSSWEELQQQQEQNPSPETPVAAVQTADSCSTALSLAHR